MAASRVSLYIPACGRPERLKNLLDSIQVESKAIEEVVIVNTTPTTARQELHDSYAELAQNYGFRQILMPLAGPSAARAQAARDSQADFVLFLDEDLRSREGNLSRMIQFLEAHPEICCCSAQWVDHRKGKEPERRPLGFVYMETIGAPEARVFKKKVHLLKNNPYALTLHDLQASILIRRNVLEEVNFDPAYDFFLELYDFFYALFKLSYKCAAISDVVFDHYPGEYKSGSQKREANIKRQQAAKYFQEKWGVFPSL